MTDLELKYYKALQGKFREAMGNEIVGDRFWCVYCQKQFTLFSNDNPSYYIDTLNGHGHAKGDPIFRLPLPIDSDDPKGKPSNRCLWGMLKSWTDAAGKTISSFNGISPEGNGFRLCTWSPGNGFQYFDGSTPVEALLCALAHQWGIEVKA